MEKKNLLENMKKRITGLSQNVKRGVAGLLIGGMLAGGAHGAVKNYQQSQQINDLKASISELENDKSAQINDLYNQIADLNSALSQNQSSDAISANEINKLKNEISKLQTELNSKTQDNAVLNSKISEIIYEINKLSSQIEQNNSVNDDLKDYIEKLQTEVNLLNLNTILTNHSNGSDYTQLELTSSNMDAEIIIGFGKGSMFFSSRYEDYQDYLYSDEKGLHAADNYYYGDESDDRTWTIEDMPILIMPYRDGIESCSFEKAEDYQGIYTIRTENNESVIEYYVSFDNTLEKVIITEMYEEGNIVTEMEVSEVSRKEYHSNYSKIKDACDKLIAEHQAREEQELGR